jgi:hypothetical protein
MHSADAAFFSLMGLKQFKISDHPEQRKWHSFEFFRAFG